MKYVPVRSLTALGLLCFAAAAEQPYRDPQGRFALEVPAGFTVTQLNSDAVQFASGPGYVTAMVLPSDDPALMISAIARQTGSQWRNFTEARRGEARFAGRMGSYVTYSGVNPRGADSFLQMLATAEGSTTFLLMTSAPATEFARLKSGFYRIEQSFVLTKATPAVPPRPPAPPALPIPAGAQPARTPERPPAVAPTATPRPSAPPSGKPDYYRMRLVRIVDEHGFERPMTALTLLIPVGWQFQGSVQYSQAIGCHANLVRLVFRAESPDGRFAMQMFPGNVWQWSDDPTTVRMMQTSNQQMSQFGRRGCDLQPPMAAGDFLRRSVIPAARHEARLVGIEPMPEIAQQTEQEARQLEQIAAGQGLRVHMRTDVARARLSYNAGGQPAEEWLTAMTYSIGMPAPTYNMYTGRMGQAMSYTCAGDHVFAFRAPEGQLDAQEKFFRTILSTIRVDPQWQARVTQVITNMQAADSKAAMDRSAIIAKSGQETSRIIHDTYENATKSHDRAMEGWSQYMRGVANYRNPYTGETVELSNQYEHAWAGPNNEYIVTDSANFNPNSALQGNWTRLEAVQR